MRNLLKSYGHLPLYSDLPRSSSNVMVVGGDSTAGGLMGMLAKVLQGIDVNSLLTKKPVAVALEVSEIGVA